MSDLSPHAQAVVDAVSSALERGYSGPAAYHIAAEALRAAILNVFYEETLGMTAYEGYEHALEKILSIANELQDFNDPDTYPQS
jgi:hypothetical protein